MADGPDSGPQGWFPNLLGWFSFIGLFATGIIGLVGASPFRQEPTWAGAAYLLIGGLAFWAVLLLVLRRVP